jgi:hypothetical protein
MTDKVVDRLLGLVKSKKIFYHNKSASDDKELTLFRHLQERRQLIYLESELKLIKYLSETDFEIAYDLTEKGNKVIEKGGWEKYSKSERNKEKFKNIRINVLFGIAILSPFISIYFSNKTLELEKGKIELEKQYKSQIKELEQELNNAKKLKFLIPKLDSLIQLSNIEGKK